MRYIIFILLCFIYFLIIISLMNRACVFIENKKTKMNTLIIFAFFTFANQILHIFGKLTVLQGPEYTENSERKRKLICVSEDDGGALVWNYNLYWNYYSAEDNDYTFRDINKFSNQEIDCKMNANEDCLKKWTKNDWSLTNSLKTPMGPVFDQRWEEFKQYENLQDTYDHVDFKLPTKVNLMFSVRTSHDAQILICNGRNYDRDFCYWIIIGGWDNTLSVIRKCPTGVPLPGRRSNSDCEEAQVGYRDIWGILSGNHWQTFSISWDSTTRSITVYEPHRIIMRYKNEEDSDFSDSHMFIRSDVAMLLRFHIYDFLHTTKQDAVLTSPIYHFNDKTICIQMLVGLCAECSADVVLRDYTTNEELVTVTVKAPFSTEHNLPLWEFVKITKKFLATDYNSYNAMIIQLIPKLFKNSMNPLWAIANVRQCSDAKALRMGTMISKQDWKRGVGYFWPTEECQKIFSAEHDTINTSSSELDINLDGTNCPEGEIGPQCSFSCYNLNSKFNCRKIKICNRYGCTCASGFSGNTCSIPCQSNKYGYGCRRTCGSCLNKEQCNKVTGECTNGCDNKNGRIYISPLCQISVDKPAAPMIINSNEITISANAFVTWKDEYEGISILYSFIIHRLSSQQGQIKYGQQTWNKLFRNMTQLTTYFENLEPGTTYNISLALSVNGKQVINSDWRIVETTCNHVEHFDITPEEKGIIIDWRNNSKYSCPANWYSLEFHNTDTSKEVVSTLVTSRPYKLNLPSYTSFNVTVLHKHKKLFSQKIHTLEGVPSRVLDLESKLSANSEITLIWKPPHYSNGEIVRYEVILKVKEYYGCTNLRLPTPDNHTIKKFTTEQMITITDLHPFTSYSAQVVAHNSRHFSVAAETTFNTQESEIPSEVFSQLRVENWKLLWSPPEDCTTITGSLKARIKISGISDAVKDFNMITQTNHSSFNLTQLQFNGVERYEATIYVIRDYWGKENVSAYQKYEFETPPTAPPKVTNLEVVEIDYRQTPAMMHLRWQSPLPPLNGKLRDYSIQICDKLCSVFEVQINESCDLWDDYVCKIIKKPSIPSATIKVFAYNVNVTEPGLPVIVTDEMVRNTTLESPGNFTYTINNNSVVDLKWLHPWRTGDHLKSFRIRINETFSNLRDRIFQSPVNEILEYPVAQYMRSYSERLYLFPSTQYNIYIEAVTANISSNSKFVEIHTPSTTAFDGVLNIMVNKSDSTILLSIPSVLNDTRDSTMHIIVKGPNLCENYSEVPENLRAQAGIKMYEMVWQAAEVSTSELAGEQFKIGDNKTYGNARNCPLKLEEFYEIVIIVSERNSSTEPIILTKSIRFGEVTSKHYEVWIIPITIFLVLVGAIFCLCRRRRQKLTRQLMQDEIDLSQKLTELLKQEEMVLSRNTPNYKQEAEYVNLKQALSSSDKYFLSRPAKELMPIAK